MNKPNANNNTIRLIIRIVTLGKPIEALLLLMYSIKVGANALKNITKINKPIIPSIPKVSVSEIPIYYQSPFPKIPRTFLDLT